MSRSVGAFAIVVGIVLMTICGWWAFGHRTTESDYLEGVDVAGGRDGSGRSRDVVRRYEPAETSRSESVEAAMAADNHASATMPGAELMDLLDQCRVEIIVVGNGGRLYDAMWRILDEDGEIVGRSDEERPVDQTFRSPAGWPYYLRSGRSYRVEVCAEGHHPLELGFALAAGQRAATVEAVLRGLDPTGSLRVRFEGPPEVRPLLVRFRIGSTESSETEADGPHWNDERWDVVSGMLELDESGAALLEGLRIPTKRHRLAIDIPDFPLTNCLPPEAVTFDFIEGRSNEVSIRLESGSHMKAIVRFPIDPAESAKVSIESTDGRDIPEPVEFIWSFDHFGGRRFRDLALRQPTGNQTDPVDRPLRTLRPLRPGRYILSIEAPGLDTERVAFEIAAGATSEIDITMRRE